MAERTENILRKLVEIVQILANEANTENIITLNQAFVTWDGNAKCYFTSREVESLSLPDPVNTDSLIPPKNIPWRIRKSGQRRKYENDENSGKNYKRVHNPGDPDFIGTNSDYLENSLKIYLLAEYKCLSDRVILNEIRHTNPLHHFGSLIKRQYTDLWKEIQCQITKENNFTGIFVQVEHLETCFMFIRLASENIYTKKSEFFNSVKEITIPKDCIQLKHNNRLWRRLRDAYVRYVTNNSMDNHWNEICKDHKLLPSLFRYYVGEPLEDEVPFESLPDLFKDEIKVRRKPIANWSEYLEEKNEKLLTVFKMWPEIFIHYIHVMFESNWCFFFTRRGDKIQKEYTLPISEHPFFGNSLLGSLEFIYSKEFLLGIGLKDEVVDSLIGSFWNAPKWE